MLKDYYRIMGLEKQATQEEIKKAFRALAKQNHPDANNADPQKEELFKEINEAYQVLGDTGLRRRYDLMCRPLTAGGMAGLDVSGDPLSDLLRAVFETRRGMGGMGGMGCRGRGFGRCGRGRKF